MLNFQREWGLNVSGFPSIWRTIFVAPIAINSDCSPCTRVVTIESYEIALEIRVKEKKLQDEAKVLNGLAQCYNLLNNNDSKILSTKRSPYTSLA